MGCLPVIYAVSLVIDVLILPLLWCLVWCCGTGSRTIIHAITVGVCIDFPSLWLPSSAALFLITKFSSSLGSYPDTFQYTFLEIKFWRSYCIKWHHLKEYGIVNLVCFYRHINLDGRLMLCWQNGTWEESGRKKSVTLTGCVDLRPWQPSSGLNPQTKLVPSWNTNRFYCTVSFCRKVRSLLHVNLLCELKDCKRKNKVPMLQYRVDVSGVSSWFKLLTLHTNHDNLSSKLQTTCSGPRPLPCWPTPSTRPHTSQLDLYYVPVSVHPINLYFL